MADIEEVPKPKKNRRVRAFVQYRRSGRFIVCFIFGERHRLEAREGDRGTVKIRAWKDKGLYRSLAVMDRTEFLAQEAEAAVRMEADNPGYARRNPNRVMRLSGQYGYYPKKPFVWGHEYQGYGGPEGYCKTHHPHRTHAGAKECGRRFENALPPRLVDAIRSIIWGPEK